MTRGISREQTLAIARAFASRPETPMEKQIPIHNPNAMPIYVAGVMIPPNETRHFAAHQVPEHFLPVAESQAPGPVLDDELTQDLKELLTEPVEVIARTLKGAPPEGLDQVEAVEKAGQARAEVLHVIAAERNARENTIAVLALLEGNVQSIVAAIQARTDLGVPNISDDDLARLALAEQSDVGKKRKSLIEAIAEEHIKRAAEDKKIVSADPEMDAFAALLKEMSDDELAGQIDLHKDSPAHLAAIDIEIGHRGEGNAD